MTTILPSEIISEILIFNSNLKLCIILKDNYSAKKVQNINRYYRINWASQNGHLEVVKWLHENRTEGCTTDAMDFASFDGYLEVVKWLHENRTEGCTTQAMNGATEFGHLEVIKWLHENRSEGCIIWAMSCASLTGHLEVVTFLQNINDNQ